MRIIHFTTLEQLAPLGAVWDRLARGVPFRSWAWISCWWRRYCDHASDSEGTRGLYALGVFDSSGTLVGMAPWYVEQTPTRGRVVRFLGTGEVCSDYLSVLCRPEDEVAVAQALADWLSKANASGDADTSGLDSAGSSGGARSFGGEPRPRGTRDSGEVGSRDSELDGWDLLELSGVDTEDTMVCRLAAELEICGLHAHCQSGPSCWRIGLPASWEEYLGRLSKSHRKQVRRAKRQLFATGRVRLQRVSREEEIPRAMRILIDLHQRRRRSLGDLGCFSSPRFTAFHADVIPKLLHSGALHFDWIELDGVPIAAEYQLASSDVIYAYQAGIDPNAARHSPGRLITIAAIERAIEEGFRGYDFLRGDEPYKAHWRGQPRGSVEIRVVAARAAARFRHGVWRAGTSVKQWIKSSLRLAEG